MKRWLQVHVWWPIYRQTLLRWQKRKWPVMGMVITPAVSVDDRRSVAQSDDDLQRRTVRGATADTDPAGDNTTERT